MCTPTSASSTKLPGTGVSVEKSMRATRPAGKTVRSSPAACSGCENVYLKSASCGVFAIVHVRWVTLDLDEGDGRARGFGRTMSAPRGSSRTTVTTGGATVGVAGWF